MVRLGGGPDSFGVILGLGVGDGAWPQLGGGFEQGAAQVLQEAQAPAVMVRPRQPRSRTAKTRVMQLVSPGSRPMTLTRRRVSPNVRSTKLECRIR